MSVNQFREWRAYADLEPFDEVRQDYRTAHIVQTMRNLWRDSKRHPRGSSLIDNLLKFGDVVTPKPSSKPWEFHKAFGKAMASAYNKVVRSEPKKGSG